MKLHVVPNLPGEFAALSERKVLQATELWTRPAHRPLWKSNRSMGAEPSSPDGLPGHGFASPMGYWLSAGGDALSAAAESAGPTIYFAAPGEDPARPPASITLSPDGTRHRPARTIRVKSPNSGDGDITLTLGAGGALIVSTPSAWRTLAEPVLLAVCQYWRFCALDAELARLTERAHGDLAHATMPGPSSLKERRRLTEDAQAARALMLDLPHFEGPLTDPTPYCSTERAAQIYANVAEKLGLEEWCELIDEKAEAIEDAYEALTEKLFEYKNFAAEAILEVVIVVILLGELALMFWENFGP